MRMRRVSSFVGIITVMVVLLGLTTAVASAATVVNGGFETGNFTGWSEYNQPLSAGSWYVYSGTSSPLTHSPIPAPPQGTYAAITDQNDPASNILYQNVALPLCTENTLSFYVYYKSDAPISPQNTLDYTYKGDNQQYRVDVMTPTSAITSLASTDILQTPFQTLAGAPEALAPTVVTTNLTPFDGQTVRLRFAQVDNTSDLYAGVDDVVVNTSPAVTTGAVTNVTPDSATLNGTVNPEGLATTDQFQYGKTATYGQSTASASAGAGTTASPVSTVLKHLHPHTTYYVRVVATNAGGSSTASTCANQVTFTTPAQPSINVSHRTLIAGKHVRIFGSAGKCPVGHKLVLSSTAFKNAIDTHVLTGSKYSVTTKVSGSTASGTYKITGRCAGVSLHTTLDVVHPVPKFTG